MPTWTDTGTDNTYAIGLHLCPIFPFYFWVLSVKLFDVIKIQKTIEILIDL